MPSIRGQQGNPKEKSTVSVLSTLLMCLRRKRRYQLGLLFSLMLASAVAEVVSLGAVLPFLGVLSDPDKVYGHPALAGPIETLGIASPQGLVLPLTFAFVALALMAGGLRMLLAWSSIRVTYAAGADLSLEAYRRTLYQPYEFHVARNSSETISGIIQKVGPVTHVLHSLVALCSSTVLCVALMVTLIAIDAAVAITIALSLGLTYGLITWRSRFRLRSNSTQIARLQSASVKAIQEGLGGIRDVLLDGTQPIFCDIYRKADQPLRRAQAENVFIGQRPRYAMETIAIILITSVAYALSRSPGGIAQSVPLLGALALGAQRLLPTAQQIYINWANITGGHASIVRVLELVNQPLPETISSPRPDPLIVREGIRLDGVRFRYGNAGSWILDGVNLYIRKGTRLGIVGATGSGKSTMLDLLMLLLEPTEGRILVDREPVSGERRRAWQRTVAHVPQSIYLADTTIAENIAFGVSPAAIDLNRVGEVARRAQIKPFVESHPEGFNAVVGERGIRVSGGQRQRIGIARALYKQASVLVFDEATSALDDATEQSVMDAIEKLGPELTIVIIAHRLTTVRRCDVIVELENGRVVAQGSYEQLMARRAPDNAQQEVASTLRPGLSDSATPRLAR